MSKLDIANEMRAFDRKDRKYMQDLTEDETKKFSPYVLMRWGASVEGNPDIQEWYLRATNERVNVGLFDVSTTKHKELQWLLCTTASPSMGSHRHYWVSTKKKDKSNTPGAKLLRQLYPGLKQDEIDLLASINTMAEIKKHAKEHGWDDRGSE